MNDARRIPTAEPSAPLAQLPPVAAGGFDDDRTLGILTALPRDHAPWVRDAATLSQRARELLARLRPAAIAVLTFWDHAVRTIMCGRRTLHVDGSGSYRLE